ncbi:MAG: hypothetical protein C0412_08535 [Flavobacterium sp.]|nr:hypothetical protein [Flavobacterium sp.]
MFKNKYLFFLFSIFFIIFISNFVFANNVFAVPIPTYLLNGNSQNVTFNPNNGEKVDIEINMSEPVKFTRLYICSIDQKCNGTSGNYTRYFSPNITSDSVMETWDGKGVGGKDLVSAGEYKVMISFTQGSDTSMSLIGLYSIFVDFSSQDNSTTTSPNTCSSFTYSNWGICSNDTQTRTVLNSMPSDCTGGSPILTQSCATTTEPQTTKIVTKTVYISTHSGEEDLSDYNEKTVFEITAGRERITTVGSPLEFDAKYILQKIQCVPIFKWSFGDGFEAIGKNVTHIYKYPGEYQIVLNGTCGDYKSVSRITVKVIFPNILISSLFNDDIEIINNGKTEINIGNWKITPTFKVGAPTEASEKLYGKKHFVFPIDTIISAGKKIILSKEDTGTNASTSRISLVNPSNREVSFVDIKSQNMATSSQVSVNQKTIFTGDSYIPVLEAERLIKEYKEKLALNEQRINKIKKAKEVDTINNTNDLPDNEDVAQTASVLDSINSSPTKTFWSKLIDIPAKSIKSFAHVFYDF